MLIPSRVPAERSAVRLRRARKGVGGAGTPPGVPGRLRDVPTPRETEPDGEGPAIRIHWGALSAVGGNARGDAW
jgi:hypothetical protein